MTSSIRTTRALERGAEAGMRGDGVRQVLERAKRSLPSCVGVARRRTRARTFTSCRDGGHRQRQLRGLVVAPGARRNGCSGTGTRIGSSCSRSAPARAIQGPAARAMSARSPCFRPRTSFRPTSAYPMTARPASHGRAMCGIPHRSDARPRRSGPAADAAEIAGRPEDEGCGRPARAAEREILVHPRPAVQAFGRKHRMQHSLQSHGRPLDCHGSVNRTREPLSLTIPQPRLVDETALSRHRARARLDHAGFLHRQRRRRDQGKAQGR
jgi:hypothetical protein